MFPYKRCTAITSFYFLMLALLNLGWGVSSVQFEEGPVESHAECVPAPFSILNHSLPLCKMGGTPGTKGCAS
ncbi:hypothetical protein C8J55DRAFT_517269 [Lentinula edodes]|uniref:Uncharacterized protein n=1 Tax=Lentinula lateritia TaxID=40482 RepID=A0A9W9A7Z3_9AGAR|nr:hypothetical protein C8J55DRAFT_517269 [Lentinula edodes]